MIQLKLITPTKTFVLDPLDGLIIPSNMQLNDSLQHQEAQVSVRVAYDSNVHEALVENIEIQAQILDNNIPVFSGVVDSGISWIDNGNPEPLDNISLVVNDLTCKLQQTTDGEFAYVNESLDNVVSAICAKCGLIYNHNYKAQNITVPVFILKQEQDYYQALSDLLFENLFSFGFTGNGTLVLIDLTQTAEDEEITDLLAGVKFSRTKKKFTGLKLSYGKLIKKENEQIYFEGGNLNEDSKVVPYIITPGSYYPVEATPVVEEENGKVFQDFSQGFAEVKTLYNGEKKLQKSENTQLIYSTDHVLVKDWSDNLTVDRKEFQYTQAAVRFYNASETDAELHQLAIKATAYYKETVEYILGTGKKYNYDTSFIYENEKAEQFAAFLTKYFLGGNYKVTFKTDTKLTPGQKVKIDLGLSGVKAQVLILNVTENLTSQNYEVTAITEQEISLDSTKYQLQKSMTADQRIQRTEYPTAIKEIQEEYYLSTSRTVLENGEWTTTPPTDLSDKYIWTRTSFIYENGIKTTTDPISVSGENGDGIESVDVEYAQNQSRTTAPTTGWQTTSPISKDGYYIWSRTKVKLKDKEATYTDAVCITGDKGNTGDSGVGIAAVTNYYLATNATSVTTATPGWTTTIQKVLPTKIYLWNYEEILYTDKSKTTTTPVIIGNYSANGTDGTDGIGIKSIAEKYAVSTFNTTAPTSWEDTPPQMTATNKYLWNYEIITYSNNTTEETAKRVIGAYGDKGVDGKDGAAGKNAIVMTSATTPNGEYNGQIGIWQGQVYQWNGSSWKLTSGILPIDPVLHYSFDELPDLPDGNAKLLLKNGKTYSNLSYIGGNTGSPIYTNSNGNLRVELPNRQTSIFFTDNNINRLSFFRIKVISGTCSIDENRFYEDIKAIITEGNEHIIRFFGNGLKHATIYPDWSTNETIFEILEVYIGEGLYNTPIIDNSGNNHNATAVKGLTTKGVSGKCLRSFSSINTGFTTKTLPLSANWSYSMWVNLESSKLLSKANKYDDYDATYTGMATMLFGVNSSYDSYGIEILCNNMFSGTKTVAVNVFERNLNSSEQKNYGISSKVVDKGFVNITVSRDDSNTKFYCDGLLVGSFSKIKTDLEIDKVIGINVAGYQGQNYRSRPTDFVIDDVQIFERPLSAQEVLGLYLAKGNTPKQFTLNDFRLNLIDDDGIISVSEKKELLRRWKEIYNAENVSTSLPTSNISPNGEYKAVIDAANLLNIGSISTITAYREATNALRDAFWGSNGYLNNMTTASTLIGNLDSLFANYRQALQNANNAISDQQSAQASAITVQMASPFVQLPVNDSGSVTSYDNSGNVITVLNGAVTLTPVASTVALADNQYSVAASGSGITAGAVSVDSTNKKVTIGNSTALTKPNAQITYTIKFKINGITGTLYSQQKISTASRGADGKRGPMYRGTTKPTTDVVYGDWYLDKSDNLIHVYNNSNWNTTVTNYNDYRYTPALNDMLAIAAEDPDVGFIKITTAHIQNLAAGNILANVLTTKELKLTGNGIIKSENYDAGISGFKIDSNGVAEFNNGVIKTPELNFAGVKGLDDNLLKNGYRLKSVFNDWGQGYFGEEPVYRCAGYDSDGKVVALYLGCNYELSFSGTLNIYLAKNEYIYCSENCKSVNFRIVISDVSSNNVNPFPTIGSSVKNVLAFTKTGSNFWHANVADKIFSTPVKAGQYITCFIEALLSAPVENVGTIYSKSIENSGTSNAFKESALYIKKENKIAKDLLKANEKVFNESVYLTRGTGVYDVRGVGFAGNYFLIGNVLVQWGQTKSYTVLKGQYFVETINLPIAYNDAGDVVGNATGLNGYNVIMSSSTKNNGGGMEYAEIWEQRTNSSFTVRTYNRNESTTIESWSLHWITIGYLN